MQESSNVPIKVLVAKIGLDGHERGARAICFGLRDEGMEVIYTGIRQSVDSVIQSAVQEDVDVLALSSMAGAHDRLPEIIEKLKEKGREDILVLVGGIIPDDDIPGLLAAGVIGVFGPGSSMEEISQAIRTGAAKKKSK